MFHNDSQAQVVLFAPTGARHELAWLVRQIQTLTLEVDELRRHATDTPELERQERTLEQLRWRLANFARRSAAEDLDSAA